MLPGLIVPIASALTLIHVSQPRPATLLPEGRKTSEDCLTVGGEDAGKPKRSGSLSASLESYLHSPDPSALESTNRLHTEAVNTIFALLSIFIARGLAV